MFKDLINKIESAIAATNGVFEMVTLGSVERDGETFPIIKINRRENLPGRPTLVIAAGFHGEEPAGPETITAHADELLVLAQEKKINLIIYPCANPWGIERGLRHPPDAQATNWFTHNEPSMPKESALIKDDLSKYQVDYYLDLHEDNETRGCYIYCFVDRDRGARVLKAMSKEIPIEPKPQMDDPLIMNADIRDGIVWDAHDGSSEDWMSHQSAKLSVCTETPSSFFPIERRVAAQWAAILKMISIAAE